MSSPGSRAPSPAPDPNEGVWPYLGIGCITIVSGFFGGGMIAVLIAKIVGAVGSCTPDAETGAPCDWFNYARVGALAGMVLFPAAALLLRRRGRMKRRNNV